MWSNYKILRRSVLLENEFSGEVMQDKTRNFRMTLCEHLAGRGRQNAGKKKTHHSPHRMAWGWLCSHLSVFVWDLSSKTLISLLSTKAK